MSNFCTPKLMIDKIEDLDLKHFKDLGFSTILLDIDSTLVPQKTPDPTERAFECVKMLKDAGFRVIIYSNNTKKRVSRFCKNLNVDYYYFWSMKPLFLIYWRIKFRFKIKSFEMLSIGDQLVTDIIGSNLAGVYSVLVKPLSYDEQLSTRINRFFERILFKYVVKK